MATGSVVRRDARRRGQRRVLFVCNGGSQLVSAIAAARTMNAWQDARRYLVVQELSAPGSQIQEFFRAIARMARAAGCWERILFFAPGEVKTLARQSPQVAARHIHGRLGVEHFDEVFLGQNATVGNRVMRDAYRGADRKVCFGDGMGVNFSQDYFPKPPKADPLGLRVALRKIRRRRDVAARESAERSYAESFDVHCLLLPNLFDQQLANCVTLSPAEFKQLLAEFDSALKDDAAAAPQRSPTAAATVSERVVLLTANHSEAGMMNLSDELKAYRGFLESLGPSKDALLIIKPHPRDSRRKIRQLKQLLAPMFAQLVALEDARSFYLPFEVLFAGLERQTGGEVATKVVGVSTAPLSLMHLYDAHCVIGFGEDIVRRRFQPAWVDFRLRHERDLKSACGTIRRARTASPVREPECVLQEA